MSWGADLAGQVWGTPEGGRFTQVAAGAWHSLALRADGSIVAWGWDYSGQVSNTPLGTGFTQVAAGGWHSLALRADGSIAAWGGDEYGQVSNTPVGTGFNQVAGGSRHSLALRADGSIESWGLDSYGQVSNTPVGTGFTQVAGGSFHSLALHSAPTWTDAGSALAGLHGDPLLAGSGSLAAGSSNAVELSNAAPSTLAGLFVALSSSPVPFKGGTLLAFPTVIEVRVLVTDEEGGMALPFRMAPGLLPGTELWVQWAIQDAAAVKGVALSNALLGVTP